MKDHVHHVQHLLHLLDNKRRIKSILRALAASAKFTFIELPTWNGVIPTLNRIKICPKLHGSVYDYDWLRELGYTRLHDLVEILKHFLPQPIKYYETDIDEYGHFFDADALDMVIDNLHDYKLDVRYMVSDNVWLSYFGDPFTSSNPPTILNKDGSILYNSATQKLYNADPFL